MDKLATLNYRPNRKKPYFVRFYNESGKRTSRAFAARMDAMQFMAEKSGDAKTSHFDISTEEKELVMRLKRECFARGFSLCDMAETFVHLVRNKPVSDYALGEVRDMYLNDCRDRGLRSSTLAYYTGKLANLCAMYGEKIPVSAITPDMLEVFISSGKTPDHNRRISSAFYKFLAEKRIVPPDLFHKVIVPRRRKKHKIPPILTVDETRRLFREIPESFIPAFVLMAFFGVRPQEISNEHGKQVLEVSNVDLVAKTVRIPETIAKMGNFRIISDAPENAWAWLEKYLPKSGKIFPYSYATYRRIRNMLTIKLPHDVLRHSFASYGYHYLGIEKTVEILGQESGYEVYKTHYKAMVRMQDSADFFSIMPSIRDGLPPRRKQKIGDLNFGLSGEVADNLAYLKVHPELPQQPA